MAVDGNSYEEIRKRRIQENIKHLEDLGISKISKSLLEVARKEYKSLKHYTSPKSKKTLETSELRRSSRARNLIPSYREEVAYTEVRSYSKRSSKNHNPERAYTGRIISYEEKVRAEKRAEQVQSDLKSGNPSFVKPMVRSHVSSCFWLGLPSIFCKANLPSHELKMVLEDEKGIEYDAIYIGKRTGLSGGWRGFAMDHNLEDGDVLVFELSEPARFKIYIIKAIDEESTEDINDDMVDTANGITTEANTPELESMSEEEDQIVYPKQPAKKNKQSGRATKRKRKQ